jgi:NTE family protein
MVDDTLRAGTALAMSGGGFRATLFHIGTLIRLDKLGTLAKLDRISVVSGGAIMAGMLACRWEVLIGGGFAMTYRLWFSFATAVPMPNCSFNSHV